MDRLTAREGRVVASLVEKALTVPQYYPLTIHALVAACNQTTSRDPVTAYDEADVLEAIESLKTKRMVRAVLPAHGRSVVRYRHVLDELLGLDAPQLAVLAVLLLRGPQTAAELRARTERMAAIESVDHELDLLASREHPLAEHVGRLPGQKEGRWAARLADPFPGAPRDHAAVEVAAVEVAAVEDAAVEDRPAALAPPHAGAGGLGTDVGALRRDLDALRAEVELLRADLDVLARGLGDLRASLGG